MKKYICSLITCILMISCCILPVNADTFNHITDKSGTLPDMELGRLNDILTEASEKTGFNVSVKIYDNVDFSECEDEFYQDSVKKYPDRIMIAVDISSDTAQIYTCGNAQKYIDENAKSAMLDKDSESISEKIEVLADDITGITAEINAQHSITSKSEKKSDKKHKSDNKSNTPFIVISGIVCGAVVGIFTGLYLKFLYRRSDNDFAVSNYKCSHKITFEVKEDKFKREFVNKSDSPS